MTSRYVVTLHRLSIAALLTLLTMTGGAASAQDFRPEITRPEGIELDLAAMTLLPQELDPAFTSNGDTLLDRDGLVNFSPDLPAREYSRHLRQADFVAHYGAFSSEFDADGDIPRSALSYVNLFGDADGARRGLALMAHGGLDVNAQTHEPATVVGEEALFTISTGTNTRNGSTYDLVDYSFRIDKLVAGVSFHIYEGRAPDEETLTDLAEQQLDRIESVLDEGSSALFFPALRLDSGGGYVLSEAYEAYRLHDGRQPVEYQDTPETYESRAATWAEIDVDAVYRTEAFLDPEGEQDSEQALTVTAALYTFSSTRDAADFADQGAERFAATAPDAYRDIEIIDTLPAFDDESSAMTFAYDLDDGGQTEGHVYWVQSGSFVIRVAADVDRGVTEDGMTALVEAQLECLASPDDLCAPVALPETLVA